jgi:hypothetical protein
VGSVEGESVGELKAGEAVGGETASVRLLVLVSSCSMVLVMSCEPPEVTLQLESDAGLHFDADKGAELTCLPLRALCRNGKSSCGVLPWPSKQQLIGVMAYSCRERRPILGRAEEREEERVERRKQLGEEAAKGGSLIKSTTSRQRVRSSGLFYCGALLFVFARQLQNRRRLPRPSASALSLSSSFLILPCLYAKREQHDRYHCSPYFHLQNDACRDTARRSLAD